MYKLTNLLLKLFVLLAVAVGGINSAWAQTDAFSFRSWDSGTFSRLTEYNTPICVSDNYTVTQAGHLKIQMSFKDGSWAFPALGVDLVNNATGEVIKDFYFYRNLGSGGSCEYQLSAIYPGSYTLRYWTLTRCGDGSMMQQNSAHPGQINISYEGSTVSPTPTRTQLSRSEYRLANIAPRNIPAGLWNQIPENLRSNGQGLLYKDETCYLRAGHYTMTFAYSGQDSHGHNSRLELRGVELRDASGNVVDYDCHYGFSGSATQANSYSFDVPSAGTYTVRSIVLPENGTANCALCNGNVTYTFESKVVPGAWQVIITGDDKRDDEQITYHNNRSFKTPESSKLKTGETATVSDGEYFYFKEDITREELLDCDFSSYSPTRGDGKTSFVYGPVIDWEKQTITCEIREAITAKPTIAGWYQLKYDVSTNNVAANTRHGSGAREDQFTNPVRQNNRFYLTMPRDGNVGNPNEYMNLSTYPTDDSTPLTFVKLVPNGNGGIMMMTIDGRFMNEAGTPNTSGSGFANNANYVEGELDFLNWFPFGDRASFMIGKASNTHNYFYTAPAKFDDNRYEFYEVHIEADQVANDAHVIYSGSTTNYSKNVVYRNGFFVFPKGYVPNVADFRVDGATFVNMTMNIEDAGAFKTLRFKESTGSAESWFTIKNTRKNYFISVSANGLEDNQQLKWGVSTAMTAGEYWMIEQDGTNGFYLINKAYGPDYVLGMESTSNGARLRMYHRSDAVSANTHFDRVATSNGGFSIVQHGHNNIGFHDLNSNFAIWNSNNVNDPGSNFVFTRVEDAVINAVPDYTVYKVDVQGSGRQQARYEGTQENVIGQTAVQEGRYILLKSDYVAIPEDFNYSEVAVSNSDTEPSYKILTLSGEEKLPRILHRRAYFYDKYNTVSADKRPANSSYVGKEYPDDTADADKGFVMNGSTKIQKTAEYRIPIYIKPGSSRQMYMPTDKLAYYQRWYDYKTETLVNQGVMPDLYSSNFKTYSNGHVAGKVASGIHAFWQSGITMKLPTTLAKDADHPEFYEDYIVGVDVSRFKDNSTNNATGDLTEPTLSQRVLFEIKDANRIATELTACVDNDKWLESRNIIFPTIKRGSTARNTDKDALPIDMDLNNYWVYDASHQLVQLTEPNQICVRVDDNTANISAELMPSIGSNTGWGGVNFSQSHFISFSYPGDGAVRTVPDNSHATVKVYFVEGGKEYQLAKFELTFVPNTDPKIITEVIGRQENGEYKSQRSPYWLEENFGRPVAELTFDNKNILMKDNLPAGGVDNAGGTDIGTYLFPLDFNLTNYAYGYEKGDGTARGEYTIANARHIPGRADFRFKPVQNYYDTLNGTNKEANNDQFYLYVDASDQPGEVMSLQINEHLCEGTRLYVSGWMSVTSYSSNPASVLLNLVAKNSTNGNSKILTSYCPGMLHTYMFDEQGNEVAKMDRTTGEASPEIVVNTQYWGLWSQLSFSFLLSSDVARNYDTFQVQVLNNCYNSSGGDYLLDNFQIFANPPRGNVDFTTPLCSDKVRHAKVHADYDMLKDLSADGVNDVGNDATWDIAASYCFIDAEMFDNYQVPAELGENLTVKDLFVKDDKGNHNLKSEYASDNKVYEVINKAFDATMVGRRCAKEKTNAEGNKYEDYGFHSFKIDKDYEQIPVYAYNDSKNDVVYRETNGDIRRIVFKEDVVRGEMSKLTDESDNNREYYPHMRPSRTYYLVFAPYVVTEESLRDEYGNIKDDIATDIFGVHQTCSYFGKFTTKDPMHVILDNAEIEADLPMKAICHGESAEFQFDMPALKADKPIYDEEYCTSNHDLDDRIVPSTMGTRHYHYQTVFDNDAVQGVIKNLPYDWWLGGTLGGKSFGGRIEDYNKATHPTYTYNQPEDIAHKKHGDPVNLAQAMIDFRFYYPDFGMGKTDIYGVCSLTDADWAEVKVQPYNNDTGYGLLQSEINTIKDFVTRGLIVLHRNTFDMPLTLEKSDKLTLAELTDMTESELSTQILGLALKLNNEQLKALEGSAIEKLTPLGRASLTFEVLINLQESELRELAPNVLTGKSADELAAMSEKELRKAIEDALKAMDVTDLETLAKEHFPDIEHDDRAYLVIRALNLMSRETLAGLTPAELENTEHVRELLRNKMIEVFSGIGVDYLRKMWSDTEKELTADEVVELLDGKTVATMNASELGVLIEHALAKITDRIIAEINSDRYIHFTLLPIMPSQENFVDEPYIFCPDPRGVKIRVTTNSPRMLDGFADMPYPDDMDNVPVRLGLSQIAAVPYSDAQEAKTLRVPLRKLGSAQKNGTHEMHLQGSGYVDNLYLVETNDPDYQYGTPEAGTMKPAILVEGGKPGDQDAYRLVAKVKQLQAVYTSNNNFMDLQFDPTMKFREGYTYRLGFNFMEFDQENAPTISCYGTMLFDMKIVPEYQKWTGAVSDDWTNDANWQRADRSDLHADSDDASVSVALADATDIRDAGLYATNDANNTSESFIPMAFTNTLIAEDAARMPQLYSLIAPQRGRTEMVNEKEVVVPGHFLGGSDPSAAGALLSSASDAAKYDMEVYDATGAWHAADNYECGLFGTYVAKGITFEPATSLYNAQLLSYNKAWVEYSLNTNRWYTIASPLQETFSGEWYSPTGSGNDKGKQLTPHFYDITYKTALNDRFNPAYYQRSWDAGTANMYRCFNSEHDLNNYYRPNDRVLDVAVSLDWSQVYNDVEVNYSAGGFSVKPVFDDDSNGEVLVRMPKADGSYSYYDATDEEGQGTNVHPGNFTTIVRGAGHHRLFSDMLATASSFTQSITNAHGASNPYYLVANPFMAPMDMDKFFAANPQFEKKYWVMTNNLQEANIRLEDELLNDPETMEQSCWTTTSGGASIGAVASLQAFFVKATAPTKEAVTVTYTAAMQKALAANESRPALKAPAQQSSSSSSLSSSLILHIEATNADGALQSQAAVVFSETADNAFRPNEDAELLLDGNTADEVATVFTAAPTAATDEAQALQFNVLSRTVTTIPVGVIAPTDETETTLTFTGTTALTDVMAEAPFLYDAANGSFTALDEEATLTVTGTSAGRYFIVSGMHIPYVNDDDNADVEALKSYNLHGIRVATPQRGTVTIRGSRKEYRR